MKILIIRFSSIGDIVLTTPVIRCLARQKNAEIHYLTKNTYLPILLDNPYVHAVHTFKLSLREVMPGLQKEKFDYVVDLHKNLRSFQVKFRLKSRSGSFPKHNLEKWLMVQFKWNKLPNIHIVDRYFRAIQNLQVTYDGQGLDYFISEQDAKSAAQKIPETVYIAFAIGAAHATKKLPVEKIDQICQSLSLPIVLLGGTEESGSGALLASKYEHVTSLCGSTSIQESAAIIKKSVLLISHDTGMMHIGAALKKPIVSIWGNTIPAFGMSPFYPASHTPGQILFEVKGLSCRPCSKIGFAKCPKGHFKCMQQQDIGGIIAKTLTIVSSN